MEIFVAVSPQIGSDSHGGTKRRRRCSLVPCFVINEISNLKFGCGWTGPRLVVVANEVMSMCGFLDEINRPYQ